MLSENTPEALTWPLLRAFLSIIPGLRFFLSAYYSDMCAIVKISDIFIRVFSFYQPGNQFFLSYSYFKNQYSFGF